MMSELASRPFTARTAWVVGVQLPSMQTDEHRDVDVRPFLTWSFGIGMSVWVAASLVLAIPHGMGHSIESLQGFEVLRDGAFPVWLGAFVAILVVLALKAARSLD